MRILRLKLKETVKYQGMVAVLDKWRGRVEQKYKYEFKLKSK